MKFSRIWARAGQAHLWRSRYVEGCWGFPYLKTESYQTVCVLSFISIYNLVAFNGFTFVYVDVLIRIRYVRFICYLFCLSSKTIGTNGLCFSNLYIPICTNNNIYIYIYICVIAYFLSLSYNVWNTSEGPYWADCLEVPKLLNKSCNMSGSLN